MKVYIGYSGCKVNQFEKNLLEEKFIELGASIVSNFRDADLIIFNTCCVTKNAEYGSRQAIRKIASDNSHAKIIVTGCYAEKNRQELLTLPKVISVIGNTDKINIPYILMKVNQKHTSGLNFTYKRIFKERSRAFLKIQDGCDSFCSYCIVPYVRGKPVSMDESLVIKNLKNLKDEKEVVLTGIHLGKWGIDKDKDFSYLMKTIKNLSLSFRIRLSSLEPNEINEELLKILSDMDNFCPHFHIPLQSGSNRILNLMKRDYKNQDFLKIITLIRNYFPDAGIGVDLIVGFPTESDNDFYDTYEFIKNLPIDYLHIFRFSPREGTYAFKLEPKVSKHIIKERAALMTLVDREKRSLFEDRFVGKEVKCLFDRVEKGFYRFITREYLKVYSKNIDVKDEFTARVIRDSSLKLEIIPST